MKRALAAILLLFAADGHAGPIGAKDKSVDMAVTVSSSAFAALAMNVTRTTDAINTWGLEYVTFTAVHDANVSATAFTTTCEFSTDTSASPTQWNTIPVWTYSSAVKEGEQKTWSYAVSGTASWPVVVMINAYRWIRCTWTGTGAAAGDTLTVTAKGSTQGA